MRGGIFSLLPNKTWPEGFMDYYVKFSTAVPDPTWCATNGVAAFAMPRKILVFCGSKIQKCFGEAKSFINSTLNTLWHKLPSPIPSGFQKYMFLYYVRMMCWPTVAIKRAANNHRQNNRKVAGGPKYNSKDPAVVEAIQKIASEKLFVNSWYPSCWLVFVYLGMPSGDAGIHFVSSKVSGVRLGLDDIRELGAKNNRRAASELQDGPANTKKVKQNPSRSEIVHKMEISDVQAKIEMLQLLISTLQSMNAAPEDVRSAQKQLVTLLTEHLGK